MWKRLHWKHPELWSPPGRMEHGEEKQGRHCTRRTVNQSWWRNTFTVLRQQRNMSPSWMCTAQGLSDTTVPQWDQYLLALWYQSFPQQRYSVLTQHVVIYDVLSHSFNPYPTCKISGVIPNFERKVLRTQGSQDLNLGLLPPSPGPFQSHSHCSDRQAAATGGHPVPD